MRLTVEENRQAIKRYGHIKPARGLRTRRCSAKGPGTIRRCTLQRGHRGPHVAHGWFGRVVAVWDSGAGVDVAPVVTRGTGALEERRRGSGRPIGLPVKRPGGVLEHLWNRIVNVVPSLEELVFLLLFLAFVGFAVHWFILMAGG